MYPIPNCAMCAISHCVFCPTGQYLVGYCPLCNIVNWAMFSLPVVQFAFCSSCNVQFVHCPHCAMCVFLIVHRAKIVQRSISQEDSQQTLICNLATFYLIAAISSSCCRLRISVEIKLRYYILNVLFKTPDKQTGNMNLASIKHDM